jgi:hypothetical protein
MDPGQGDAAGHLNATPDKGFDTQQGDGELVDRRPWRHADKYVVLLRHMAMGILVERLWTFACARVAPGHLLFTIVNWPSGIRCRLECSS